MPPSMVQSDGRFKRAAAVANPVPYCYGFPGRHLHSFCAGPGCRAVTAERNPLNLFNAAAAGLPADPAAAALAPTPTRNSALPFRRGGFASLCEALDYAALGDTGLNFFDGRGRLVEVLVLPHAARTRAGLRAPPDRRRHGARRADAAGRRHMAGLLRGVHGRAVCPRGARAGRHAGRLRRDGGLYRQPAQPVRRLGRVRPSWRPTGSPPSPNAPPGTAAPGSPARWSSSPACLNRLTSCDRCRKAGTATSSSPRAARACRWASISVRTA